MKGVKWELRSRETQEYDKNIILGRSRGVRKYLGPKSRPQIVKDNAKGNSSTYFRGLGRLIMGINGGSYLAYRGY